MEERKKVNIYNQMRQLEVQAFGQGIQEQKLMKVYSRVLPQQEAFGQGIQEQKLMKAYSRVSPQQEAFGQGIQEQELMKVYSRVLPQEESFGAGIQQQGLMEVYHRVSVQQEVLGLEDKTQDTVYNEVLTQEDVLSPENQTQNLKTVYKRTENSELELCNQLISKEECKLYGDRKYILTNNGYFHLEINGEVLPIANFIIKPRRILVKDDGVTQEIKYELTCILNNNEENRNICIYSEELRNCEWIKRHLGAKYYIFEGENTYKYLEIFIAEELKNIKNEVEFLHVGWRKIGGTWAYLHGGGAIGINDNTIKGSKDKVIERDYTLNKFEAAKKAFTLLEISNDNSKTVPLFLFAHLAVIRELFVSAKIEPKFILWIYGMTGSMKTSVSKIFFNLFNRSGKEKITATFKDTITAIELKAFEYKDSVLLVDDFHPTTSTVEKKEMEKLASEIIRRFGDLIGKSRSNKNLTKQREYPPRGMCVITGEDKINVESTISRCITIEISSGDFISEKLLYHQNNPLILSTHLYYFIEWVSKNFEILQENIKGQFDTFRKNNKKTFRHGRFGDAFIIYTIVSNILLLYCYENKFLSMEHIQEIRKEWENVIFNLIETNEMLNTSQDPAIMYLIAIQELIASNKCKIISIGEASVNKTRYIGYFDDEKYYLFPQTAFSEVKDFWKRLNIEFPVSSEQVNKALDKLNVIETRMESDKKRRTLKISGYGNDRFLVINIEKMNKLLNLID